MAVTLAAREITVRYGSRPDPVLAALTLEVLAGAFVGVVGPNGSGKSTLVRALSRTLRPAQGVVLLAGKDLYAQTTARQSAQAVGVVPQSGGAVPGFTVREVVRMGRAPHLPRRPFAGESPEDERAVASALREAGVADLAERPSDTLSGGEWQRVLLARALAQQPRVLLLDEPTAHQDIRHQWETLALARALAHGGRAVLAVLHDLNLASIFCDRLVLLDRGRIVMQGNPAEVLTPSHLESVYGVRVLVRPHPESGRPQVLPPTEND